ncbi:hypothetical protein Nepgr_004016 [Nepenthes gracilis]|uniref:Uncharacterized protein n=1 Tax=Nepenthes gracilis TaxID=150966 RepID=A0AAD3S0L9_NEPGR|nr:hypothetical protein Nepgr_004016 [Nepenthes gracilis]
MNGVMLLMHGGRLGLVDGQDPSAGFCYDSMQLELGYGWSSIVINFCLAQLDVLALICLPWMIVAAVCHGCNFAGYWHSQIALYSPAVDISSTAAVVGLDYDLDVDAGLALDPV